MGLPIWAKRKLEETWFASLFKAIMKMEGFSDVGRGEKFGFKKEKKNFFIRKHAMKGNEVEGKTTQKGKNPNNFKTRVSNPKEISLRRGLF